MEGIKHLIECQCILPIFKNRNPPLFHKFSVFSIINENDEIQEKIVKCSNCGAIHKIIDICKSSILPGREDAKGVLEISDLKISLSSAIVNILETYKCDLASWEEAKFISDNKLWGKSIVLTREEVEGVTQGKILLFVAPGQITIETFSRTESF